jgi:serine/threonine protein kinase
VLYSKVAQCWKIADFGFTSEGNSTRVKISDLGRGTPCYRPPELLREERVFSTKTDIWSLGCIVYEIFMNKTPFLSEFGIREWAFSKEREIIEIHIHSNPTPASDCRECLKLANESAKQQELLLGINRLLNRMLSVNPDERPSALELRRLWQDWEE